MFRLWDLAAVRSVVGRARFAAVLIVVVALWGCAPKRIYRQSDVPAVPDLGLFEGLDLTGAEVVPHAGYEGAESILLLKSGTLLIQAGMEIDADGSPNAKTLDPLYGQLTTSMQYPGVDGPRRFVDSEKVPYIVLPMGFYERFGIALGDIAAVSYRGKVVFAIFADVGPAGKMGEGSIRLAELLGHRPWESWRNGETFSTNGGISEAVVRYLVFPGSRVEGVGPGTVCGEIERVGAAVLEEISGELSRRN